MRPAWSGVAAALLFAAAACGSAASSEGPPLLAAVLAVTAAGLGATFALKRATWGAPALALWTLLPAVIVRLVTGDGALAGTWLGAAIAGAGLLASLHRHPTAAVDD